MNAALATVIAIALAVDARSDVLHVPADFPTIQAAIDAARDSDEIVVAPGTYNEAINLLGKAVHLRSSDGPEKTIIEGPNVAPAITCDSGEGPDTIIEGFEIRTNLMWQWPSGAGGFSSTNSSPVIVNCSFGSTEPFGAHLAIDIEGGSPAFVGCTFTNIGDAHSPVLGGAIRVVDAKLVISGCTLKDVHAYESSAIVSIDSELIVVGSTFTNNSSGHDPHAGVISVSSGTLHVAGSTFTKNSTWFGGAGAIGPGFGGSSPAIITIADSVFDSNWSDDYRGAVSGAQSITGSTIIGNAGSWGAVSVSGVVEDCLFEGNMAEFGAGALSAGTNATIANCVFLNNTSLIGPGAAWIGPATVVDCVFKGNVGGRFASPFEEHAGAIATFDPGPQIGNSTFCDNSPDHIFGPWINLGSNQFGLHCPVGDLTGDGIVGVGDLLMLLAQWGACDDCVPGDSLDSGACPADLDGDCNVGVSDLLILLANWG